MKNIFYLSFLALFLSCGGWSKNMKKGEMSPITLMSYNMRIASPPSLGWGNTELDSIARVIRENKPDLVALQEVDRYTDRSGKSIHQAAKLAEMTGMNYYFAPAEKKSGGYQGVGILSKFPIMGGIKAKLPTLMSSDNGETRSLAGAWININGAEILFLCTHLDHRSIDDRMYQAEQILEEIQDYTDQPIIFAGDFNSQIHKNNDGVYSLLSSEFELIKSDPPLTFPQIKPRVAIDHFLLNKPALDLFVVKDYYTIEEEYASDHLPLVLELEMK